MQALVSDPTPRDAVTQPVAVVVVTWNSRQDIERCLVSVVAEQPAEVIVVDNASTDGTPAFIRERFPAVRVVELKSNTGFAAGCNQGVRASRSPYVLFLNADAEVLPGYLHMLVAALIAEPKAASATGKLFCERNGERFIDSAGIDPCAYALRPLDRGYGERDCGQYDYAEAIFGPSGAAALYRRAALDEAGTDGPFDESFFAYYEDVDLAWRLSNRGWRHLYIPRALARHERRGAAKKPSAVVARAFANRYVTWMKNESPWRFALYAWVAIPWELTRVLRRLLSGAPLDMGEIWRRTRAAYKTR